MAKLSLFVSATIVGILLSFTAAGSPKNEFKEGPATIDESASKPLDDNMVVTPPPTVNKKNVVSDPRYYPYRQALTFRTGYDSTNTNFTFDNWVLGFQYLFPKFLSPKLEAGADLVEGGSGHLHAGMRWFYNERSYFRPSVKLSMDLLAEPKDGIATLTKLENYFVRGSATLEYVFWNPYSVRLEYELLANLDQTRNLVMLGISHGW